MRNYIYLTALSFIISFVGIASSSDQSFSDYMKQQFGEFQEFKEERDKEFSDYLKKQWEEFNAFKGIKRDTTPKPKTPPVASKEKPPEIKTTSPDIPVIKEIKIPELDKLTPVEKIKPVKPAIKPEKTVTVTLDFYGTKLEFDFDKTMVKPFAGNVNNKAIGEYWEKMSLAEYDVLVNQIKTVKQQLDLQDWGTFLLTRVFTESVFSDVNSQRLFQWYILSKLSYDAKIGYKDNIIYLLIPSEHTLYGITYFTIDKTKYYAIDTLFTKDSVNSLKTYEGGYKNANKFAFFKTENPKIHGVMSTKKLHFESSSGKYDVELEFNQTYVKYYKNFPQTMFPAYLEAPPSYELQKSLMDAFDKLMKGNTEIDAVNILLSFLQKGLKYKTDLEQFGFEKYLTPEETIYYPYSDCEDRSLLFAYIVKNMLGLDVVLIDYPGHVACAVNFTKDFDIKGDFITYNEKKYYIADPTYINAGVGMTMPLVKNKKFDIIPIYN